MGSGETRDEATARADRADARAVNLEVALDHRDVIGMAKGILMHAQGIGPEEAFEVLVRASQNRNRKLHDIAAELVAGYPERASRDRAVDRSG